MAKILVSKDVKTVIVIRSQFFKLYPNDSIEKSYICHLGQTPTTLVTLFNIFLAPLLLAQLKFYFNDGSRC